MSESRIHGVVAAQVLLHLHGVVHSSRTGSRHLFLLLQRGTSSLASRQGGLDEEGHRTEEDC